MAVYFIDTSVLCNMVPVPGRDNDRAAVIEELQQKVAARDVLILPVAAVVETGNFIAQVSDGRQRRTSAINLSAQLQLAANGQAPYIFHDFSWNPAFVQRLIEGAGTGSDFVEHAVAGLGAGDLLILAEIDAYRARTGLTVHLWTRDQQLASLA